MLPQNKPDRIRILFDDHRLVANAGLLLPATGGELVDHHLDLGGAPGRSATTSHLVVLTSRGHANIIPPSFVSQRGIRLVRYPATAWTRQIANGF